LIKLPSKAQIYCSHFVSNRKPHDTNGQVVCGNQLSITMGDITVVVSGGGDVEDPFSESDDLS